MTTTLLPGVTGVLALADGTILQGIGCGAVGSGGPRPSTGGGGGGRTRGAANSG